MTSQAIAVPFEKNVDFSQEVLITNESPLKFDEHWTLNQGEIDLTKSSIKDNSFTISELPFDISYSFYPERYRHSRYEFGDFYAKLELKFNESVDTITWGILDSEGNKIFLEYETSTKRARTVNISNNIRETGQWYNDIKEKPVTELLITRVKNKIFFSINATFTGAWEGTIPKYMDFNLKVTGTPSSTVVSLKKLTISPMPDKTVSSMILPQPGTTSPAVELPKYQDIGGGINNGYLWGKQDKPAIGLNIDNYKNEEAEYILKLKIFDWQNNALKSWQQEVKLPPNESLVKKISLPNNKFGFFTLQTQLFSRNGTPVEAPRFAGYGITAAQNPNELNENSILGIHGNPFSRLGIKWVRFHDNGVGTYWPGLEPEKGKWEWGYLDSYVDKSKAHGMNVLAVLGFTPKWASSDLKKSTYMGQGAYAPAKDLKDWENYCRKTVQHLKGRVKYYEIWNEPNGNKLGPKGFFFEGSVEEYLELLKIAYKVVKEVDSDALVLAPSGTGSFFPFLDKLLELGGGEYFDILSVHTYCTPLPPEIGYHFNTEKSYLHRLNRSREIMQKYNSLKPIWNTEIGYHAGIETRLYGPFLTQNDIAAEAIPEYWPNWKHGWPFRPLAPTRTTAFMVRFGILSMVYDVQKCFVHHKLCRKSGDALMPAPALAWFNSLFDAAGYDKTYADKEQLQVHGFQLKDGRYCIAAWMVENETLMMKKSRDEQIANVETAPLLGAEQNAITLKNTVKIETGRKKYFPAKRKKINIKTSVKPDKIFDIWGNSLNTMSTITMKEAPIYLIFAKKPAHFQFTKEFAGYYEDDSPQQPESGLSGKLIQGKPSPPVIKSQQQAIKLNKIQLKNAVFTDGSIHTENKWIELSPKKGLKFTAGPKAPAKGRLVFYLRASSKPGPDFRFKYQLFGDGADIPLKQWKRFPNKVLMKGKGWTLTCGYLISPTLPLKEINEFILRSSRSHSHIINIGILPENN